MLNRLIYSAVKKSLLLLGLILLGFHVSIAQTSRIEGIVLDSISHQPLAFVAITVDGGNNGCVTDIDGKFHLEAKRNIRTIKLSYLGYADKILYPSTSRLTVYLQRTYLILPEFIVAPKDNPALRIVKQAIANRAKNNPENLGSFTYDTYSKMVLTAKPRKQSTANKPDSSEIRMQEMLKKTDLFIMESVTERLFKHPAKTKERVLASRVSGFKNPALTLLASQMQSFSFYTDLIRIMDKGYLSPIASGSTEKYTYVLTDTIVQQGDSVFVVSFNPNSTLNMDGLKGVMYINNQGYALQNVIAEPVSANELVNVKIQQKYVLIEGKQWFPAQLDAAITYGKLGVSSVQFYGLAQTFITNVKIDVPLENNQFDRFEFQVNADAADKDSLFWSKYRSDSLTPKNKHTYQLVDSIGKKKKFDAKLKVLETLVKGKIPYKFIDLDINKLLSINKYEGYRLGADLHTNDKLVRFASIGGYFAYGTTDKHWKYGGDMRFALDKRNEISINVGYKNDVAECGGTEYDYERKVPSQQRMKSEAYRCLYVDRMFTYEKYSGALEFRAFQYLLMNVGVAKRAITEFGDVRWIASMDYPRLLLPNYHTAEVAVGLKYAYKEKYAEYFNTVMPIGSRYPILLAQLTKGTSKYMAGDIDYTRLNAKLLYSFENRYIGKSFFKVEGGYIDKAVPYSLNYSPASAYGNFPIYSGNSFVTMRADEFLSSRFVSGYFTQDFGKLLFSNRIFKSTIAFATGAYIGTLSHPEAFTHVSYAIPRKGYFESGLMLNNIIKSSIDGIGLGCFYRYGAYHRYKESENFTYTLTITLNF